MIFFLICHRQKNIHSNNDLQITIFGSVIRKKDLPAFNTERIQYWWGHSVFHLCYFIFSKHYNGAKKSRRNIVNGKRSSHINNRKLDKYTHQFLVIYDICLRVIFPWLKCGHLIDCSIWRFLYFLLSHRSSCRRYKNAIIFQTQTQLYAAITVIMWYMNWTKLRNWMMLRLNWW